MPRYGYWRYGSIRIFRDGRVNGSARAFVGLPWLSFVKHEHDERIDAEIWGRVVFALYLRRGRVIDAAFTNDLTVEEMDGALYALKAAGHGLERWIVPGLERTQARLSGEDWGQELFKALPSFIEAAKKDIPLWNPPRGSKAWRVLQRRKKQSPPRPPAVTLLSEATPLGKSESRKQSPTGSRRSTRRTT